MSNAIKIMKSGTAVGLDVHARSVSACAVDIHTGEVKRKRFGCGEEALLAEWLKKMAEPVRCVYESGVTGFHLARTLDSMGVSCVIGAVSKMAKSRADRDRKTDANDAWALARMMMSGEISEVWIPDEECEAVRDLVRAQEDARHDLKAARQRLSHFLIRKGFVFDERTKTGRGVKKWGRAHWAWIMRIELGDETARLVMEDYIAQVRFLEQRKRDLERAILEVSGKRRWKRRVDALMRLRGVSVITALALVAEAGEFKRFRNARAFSSWLGLVPKEHSSGETRRKGGITRAGNSNLRALLCEGAWQYVRCTSYPKQKPKGQEVSKRIELHAAKGIKRLTKRRDDLLGNGVAPNKANIATARELACWAWAIGCMAEA